MDVAGRADLTSALVVRETTFWSIVFLFSVLCGGNGTIIIQRENLDDLSETVQLDEVFMSLNCKSKASLFLKKNYQTRPQNVQHKGTICTCIFFW